MLKWDRIGGGEASKTGFNSVSVGKAGERGGALRFKDYEWGGGNTSPLLPTPHSRRCPNSPQMGEPSDYKQGHFQGGFGAFHFIFACCNQERRDRLPPRKRETFSPTAFQRRFPNIRGKVFAVQFRCVRSVSGDVEFIAPKNGGLRVWEV